MDATREPSNPLPAKRLDAGDPAGPGAEPPDAPGLPYPPHPPVSSSGGVLFPRKRRGRPPGKPPWRAALDAQKSLEVEATARAICLANGLRPKPLSAKMLAAEHGIPFKTVCSMNSLLRKQGLIGPSERQVQRTSAGARLLGVAAKFREQQAGVGQLTAEELLEGVLTPDGRRRVLSGLARSGPEPVQVSAIRALEEMDRQTGQQVGPPAPVTDEEVVERQGRMLYAAGPEIGGKVIEWACAKWKADEARGDAGAGGDVVDGADDGGGGPDVGDSDAGGEPGPDVEAGAAKADG